MENIHMDLRLFDANTQVTTQQSLTEEMKTFYSDYLIDAAEPELVHDQFAQKHPIPANGGKTIQFRRFAPLGKALTALTEGVTPDGQSLSMTTVEAAVAPVRRLHPDERPAAADRHRQQSHHGHEAARRAAGRTLDTITREVLGRAATTCSMPTSPVSGALPAAGAATPAPADTNYLSVDCSAAPCARSKTPTAAASTARSRSSSTPTWPMTS